MSSIFTLPNELEAVILQIELKARKRGKTIIRKKAHKGGRRLFRKRLPGKTIIRQ